MQQNLHKGVGFILISAFSIAFFNLFAKLGLKISFFPIFLLIRFLLPFLLLLPFFFFAGRPYFTKTNLKNQLLRILVVFLMQFFIFLYLKEGSVTDTVMIWNSAPIFIPIICRIFYKQRASRVTWFAMYIGLLGVACILKPNEGLLDIHGLYGLLAAILVGFSQVLYGVNVLKNRLSQNLTYLYGGCTVLALITFLVTLPWSGGNVVEVSYNECLAEGGNCIFFFVMMTFASISNQFFLGSAYKNARPISLAPFIYVSVVIAGFLQWIVFKEAPDFLTVVGSILIILASLLKWSYLRKK